MYRGNLRLFMFGIVAGSALGASTAHAVLVDFGSDSTYINQNSPGSNFGASAQIIIDGGASEMARGLLLFSDLFGAGAGQIPTGATINFATLELTTTSNASAETHTVHQVLSSWAEDTVTWNNFGAGPGGIAGTDWNSTATASFTPNTANTTYQIDVTAVVQNWQSGATNLGFLVNSGGTDGTGFVSDDGVQFMPRLAVDFAAIPEPSAFLFLALIGCVWGTTKIKFFAKK
jgi:hypothetical protein